MKNKKKVLIICGIVIVLIAIIMGTIIIQDFNQEGKLRSELKEISKMINASNPDIEEINKRLEKYISKGDYLTVEKAYKKYLKDNFDATLELVKIIEDERLTGLLTVSNYQKDGPNFSESKSYIAKAKIDLEKVKDAIFNFYNTKKIMSYIENDELDDYYINFYKEIAIPSENEVKSDKESIEKSISSIVGLLNDSEKVLIYLNEKQDRWEIVDNKLVFKNSYLLEQYNNLLPKI